MGCVFLCRHTCNELQQREDTVSSLVHHRHHLPETWLLSPPHRKGFCAPLVLSNLEMPPDPILWLLQSLWASRLLSPCRQFHTQNCEMVSFNTPTVRVCERLSFNVPIVVLLYLGWKFTWGYPTLLVVGCEP